MKNAKFNIAFASFGFLLSFIVGIFAPVTFGVMCLRAILFAVLFAAISVGIQFLFKTVLATGDEQHEALGAGEDSKTVGSVVDIVLPDEDLPNVENAPLFNVGDNHQMLNESDYRRPPEPEIGKADEPVSAAGAAAASVQNAAASAQPGFTAAPLASVAQSSVPPSLSQDSGAGELPSLPDFSIGEEDDSSEGFEDADLPDEKADVLPPRSAPKSSNANVDNKDTVLMAKAISSVLANDDS